MNARGRSMRSGIIVVVVGFVLVLGQSGDWRSRVEAKTASAQDASRFPGNSVRQDPMFVSINDDVLIVKEDDVVLKDFKFRDGERIAELRLHYRTLGRPARDSAGHVSNAVMILHGTGGTGAQFLQPQFADELFRAGQLLDAAKYYIILPDGIGHGKSSKPSDGLRAKFPQYDYDDMVAAHHALLQHLGVEHLRLILGTSMGCMHAFVWGETYPEFM